MTRESASTRASGWGGGSAAATGSAFATASAATGGAGRPGLRGLVAQARLPSPLGPIRLAATEHGLAGLWFDGQRHHPGLLDAPEDRDQRWIAEAAAELAAYWRGARPQRFRVPLDPRGTPFQLAVWRVLVAIAPGSTSSYAQVAERAGVPRAVRAVGAAIGRNPIGVIVPCHRVIGHDGSLTGYAGGLERKRALLRLEGAWPR